MVLFYIDVAFSHQIYSKLAIVFAEFFAKQIRKIFSRFFYGKSMVTDKSHQSENNTFYVRFEPVLMQTI